MERYYIRIWVLASCLLYSFLAWSDNTTYEELRIGDTYSCRIYDFWSTTSKHKNIKWNYSDVLDVEETDYIVKVKCTKPFTSTRVVCTYQEAEQGSDWYSYKSHTWEFSFVSVPVNSVRLWSPIYIEVDGFDNITPNSQWMTISPEDATVEKIVWTSTSPSVASINNSGHLVGVNPGTTTIYCTVNGSVRSNEAQVIVSEPKFTFAGFSLDDGATSVETKPTITATYSLDLSQGSSYGDIALTDAQGQKVEGSTSLTGKELSFTPTKHLQPQSKYTLTIPAGAVKNKWGTSYAQAQSVNFTTTDWKRMTLTAQPDATYMMHGDPIVLSCSAPEADIFYSTDGGEPTTRYTAPLTFEQDMTLRAVARLDGYYDTEVLVKDYMQRIEIAERFPDAEPLYVYADVNPSITFSQLFSGDLSGITLQREDTQLGTVSNLAFEPIQHDRTLYFVPAEPLETGMTYVVKIPEGTLTTAKGEQMAATEWRFTTGSYATAVSTGGPELMAALKTGGSVWTWGWRLTEANVEDGSWSYDTVSVPTEFCPKDVIAISSGYTHHALLKNDGSLWMWGRQLCGEFGNGSTVASATPIYIMDRVRHVSCGLQTTAIVRQDGSLWMCGRNDLGQVDTTRTVRTQWVQVMDGGVAKAELGWGFLTVTRADGTTETRTWDETADERRAIAGEPADVADMSYGWQNAVALGRDGSVWAWDDGDVTPQKVMEGRNPQPLEGIGLLADTLRMEVGGVAVLPARPVPLLADYDRLTWTVADGTVAQVSSRGVVTALADGETTVMATIGDAYGATFATECTVMVGVVSGIAGIPVGNWWLKVRARGRSLVVSGVPEGTPVSVYAVSGVRVYQGRMQGAEMVVATAQPGIYVVRAAGQAAKVSVR